LLAKIYWSELFTHTQLFIFHEQAESLSFPCKFFFVFFSKKSCLQVFFFTIFDALNWFYTQKQRKKINFWFIELFFDFHWEVYLAFGSKMVKIQLRKMVLDKKFHKTGGSHISFHSWGIFWDVKKPVITAALAGDFFTAQKCGYFDALF
jgi:hypothetical protein